MAWKDLSGLRKALNLGFGALFLAMLLWVLWPLVSRPVSMWFMCDGLVTGDPKSNLEAAIAQHGFRSVSEGNPVKGQEVTVFDPASLGKTSCVVDIDQGAIQRARFFWGGEL